MAKIKILKQGEIQVLPRTIAEAVNTDSGLSVQAELDALKGSTPDASAQITAHNTNPNAHEDIRDLVSNAQQNLTEHTENKSNPHQVTAAQVGALPLSGGTLTGTLVLSGNPINVNDATTKTYVDSADATTLSSAKNYTDEKIDAIPTPDVSAQIEAHNNSDAAHANMHWLTADDEMLSSIELDGSIDADTLEGHPASYFATKTDLESIDLSDYVLKSELSSLVPAPDLTNYYTKAQVDDKITQIQQLIDQAAALVDQINGEVI